MKAAQSKIKRNKRLGIACACVLAILASCTANRSLKDEILKGEEPFIESNTLINSDKFIQEGTNRSEDIASYGPDVDESDAGSIRDDFHDKINEEKPKDYINFLETKNVFPIDLNVENMDIRVFAKLLSNITGVNILVSDEVRGMVTAKLSKVNWPQALDSVLQIKSLAKHVDNKSGVIRIHSQEVIVKLEDFERNRREALQKTLQLDQAAEPLYTEVFKLFYTKPDLIKPMIEEVLGVAAAKAGSGSSMRNTNAQVTVDKRLNQLIIKARKDDLAVISKLIEKTDTRTKQVLIEAFIVEVSDDFQKALGTRIGLNGENSFSNVFDNKTVTGRVTGLAGTVSDTVTPGDSSASLTNLPATGALGGIGFVAGLGSIADLKVELTALEQQGLSKVISNPRVFTLDNQEAVIFQGDEIPYETVSAEGTDIEFKEAGLKLAVTPSVVGDGNLVMQIKVNKDTVDSSQANPPITKSEIQTSLVSKDGAIVVIGGIYTQVETGSKDQIPLFGDIPVLGKMFQRNAKSNTRKELMIFIAPHVL